jgi:hypothetical protein
MTSDKKSEILSLMKELKIDEIPLGVYFTSCKNKYEGFNVNTNGKIKSFVSKSRSLFEKLQLAIEYHSICNDQDKIKTFQTELNNKSLKLISKKRTYDENVLLAMKENNILEIPMYIRYEKRCKRFFVQGQNKKQIYFIKNNPIESLNQALKYLAETDVGSENSELKV